MEFFQYILISLAILVTSIIFRVESEEPAKPAKIAPVVPLPENFTFRSERVLPDGEVRTMQLNPAFRTWEKDPPERIAKPKSRVVGGRRARLKEVPYQVSIGVYGFGQWCGGTVYNKQWIVTAAHCFFEGNNMKNKSSYFVTAGEFDLARKDRGEVTLGVDDIIVHEDYSPRPGFSDIALIKMDKQISYTDFIQPLPIGPSSEIYPSGDAFISGWGYTKARQPNTAFDATAYSSVLKCTTIHVYTREECMTVYGKVRGLKKYAAHETLLCAGEMKGGKDACQGDSGGPLRCTSGGKKYLCGVVSTGLGCGLPKQPGFFTIVSKFVDWIKQNAGEGDQPTITY